jgi:hypothetical protein
MSTLRTGDAQSPGRPDLGAHYDMVCRGFRRGRLTAVLGAGASLFGRSNSADPSWAGAPSAAELAGRLAREFRIPEDEIGPADLLTVAQWIVAMRGGTTPLYEELHDVFDRDLPTTPLHTFLATVPGRLREKGLLGEPPLFVTTNYDDLLEQAFDAVGEPYDLVVYMADGEYHGRFCHQPPGGSLEPISQPEEYQEADPARRSVIVKLHGYVDRHERINDSYVITEDHYIEYLGRADLDRLLPVSVITRLLNCHLLFLGYSLRDWNLRAILFQLRSKAKPNDWWSVQLGCDEVERRSWEKRDVEMIDVPLEVYLDGLTDAFEAWLSDRS